MPSTMSDRVDGLSTATALKAPVKCATTGPITLYGVQTIDGLSCVAGERVLVKDQTNSVDNGIWVVAEGSWSRAPDFDGNRDAVQGTLVSVYGGTVNGAKAWQLTTANPIRIGTSPLTFDLWPEIANDAELITYRGRSLDSRLGEIVSVKDYGAIGDGVADDTDAIEACVKAVYDSGRGAIILFPPGVYNVVRSLQLSPNEAGRPYRNIVFLGQGSYGANPGTMIRYRGTSITDPGNYQNGLFDVISGMHLFWENINFMNDTAGINQLIRIRAEDPDGTPPSSWKGGFHKCLFQNPADATKELSVGHVLLYNTLDYSFRDCWWMGSPVNVVQGCNPDDTTGIAGGYTGRISYDNCYFTGDTVLRRSEVTNFQGCTWAERWENPAPFSLGAKLIMSNNVWAHNIAVNVIGNQFEGMFLPSVFTNRAIEANTKVSGLVVQGNSFGSGYATALFTGLDCTGIVFKANFLDLDNTNSRGVVLASNFVGSIDIGDNPMSAAMVSAGGAMLTDNRPYTWPHLVNVVASSDYEVNAANTWETALSSSAVSYPAGWYRLRGTAIVQGGTTNSSLAIRVLSSSGHGSSTCTLSSVQTNETASVVVDEVVRLPAGSSVTWHLQVYEITNNTGKVRAMAIGSTPGTALRITYEG